MRRLRVIPQTKVLDASGHPWRPTATQAEQLYPASFDSYKGASTVRRQGALWAVGSGSADADFLPEQETLRARSRDQYRNNPIAAGAGRTMRLGTIGSGLRLRPDVDAEMLGLSDDETDTLNRQILSEWNLFSDSVECDVTRTSDFFGLQDLAFNAMHESGDCLVLLPFFSRPGSVYSTRVQVVESDRVSTPADKLETDTLLAGVKLDKYGAPEGYYVSKRHPNEYALTVDSFQWDFYKAFSGTGRKNTWLLYDRERPGQTRGVPWLAVVIESLKQLERYADAELQAAVVAGAFTVFVTSPESDGFIPTGSISLNNESPTGSRDYALDYGAVVGLAPGEQIQTATPGRPNTAFAGFVEAILTQVGAATGVPYELLVSRFQASYSASRAALLEADKFFKAKRARFAKRFCQPVFEAFLQEAVLRGRLQLPGFVDPALKKAYARATWVGPTSGQLDPVKETKAARDRVSLNVSTLGKEAAETSGEDFESIVRQRAREERLLKKAGLLAPVYPSHQQLTPELLDPEKALENDSEGTDSEQ